MTATEPTGTVALGGLPPELRAAVEAGRVTGRWVDGVLLLEDRQCDCGSACGRCAGAVVPR